jgi:phospholipid/cholesterol/gamma-HCH transport system substrate-binding protein
MNHRVLLSNLGLLVVLVVGVVYVLLGVVGIDPRNDRKLVTINLTQSGGLLDRSEVTFRGVPVGKIKDIRLRPGGVSVDVLVDENAKIPADTDVVVAGLSAAGEQYLDFRPRTDSGPFLADGAVIEEQRTTLPTPFAELMVHLNQFSSQIDPKKLDVVITELAKAFSGAGPDLKKILDGGDYLLAGLEGVLPETVSLLDNGKILLNTASDLQGQLGRLATAGTTLGDTLRAADPSIRALLDQAPGALDLVDGLIKENKPTMAALLGDLSTVSEVVSLRLPGLGSLLPDMADGSRALTGVVQNGALVALVDIYPRLACDYGVPRRPPTEGGSPPPPLYNYCKQSGPTLQQRGSANAPRPSGDDTAGPPRGVTGGERTRAADPAAAAAVPASQPGSYARWLDSYLKLMREGR